MRDDRDSFDPDFSPSWSGIKARRSSAVPLRVRLVCAGLCLGGTLAMIITAFLVRG